MAEDYKTWLAKSGINDPTVFSKEEQLGLVDSYGKSMVPTTTGNTQIDYANSTGLGGLTQGTWNNLGQAAGLAGSAYNLYDQTLGNSADLYKEKIGMLREQRAANQEALANHRAFNNVWNNAGKGLAASSVKL